LNLHKCDTFRDKLYLRGGNHHERITSASRHHDQTPENAWILVLKFELLKGTTELI